MSIHRSEVGEVVQAITALPDIVVTQASSTLEGWSIDCLMELTPAGEQSLSIIAFVVDRRVAGVSMDIGGQHDDHPGRACFSLRGSVAGVIPVVAFEIDFGRNAIAGRERKN